jgi:hypothetical protein
MGFTVFLEPLTCRARIADGGEQRNLDCIEVLDAGGGQHGVALPGSRRETVHGIHVRLKVSGTLDAFRSAPQPVLDEEARQFIDRPIGTFGRSGGPEDGFVFRAGPYPFDRAVRQDPQCSPEQFIVRSHTQRPIIRNCTVHGSTFVVEGSGKSRIRELHTFCDDSVMGTPSASRPCGTKGELVAEVRKHLVEIGRLSETAMSALSNHDDGAFMRADREMETTLGRKERALGALRQHCREHGC